MKPMPTLDRRQFLALTAATLPAIRTLAQAPAAAKLTLHADLPGPTVPANFIGLSYETQQLSDPSYFSAANAGLIAQFRALAPHGVLRLGGNTSDYGFWKPTPASVPPPRAKREYKVGDPPPDLSYPVTPEAVRNLNAFLEATGWTCLYGINLGTNTPALAAEEAVFVAKTLGPRLEYFQVGNEADRFGTTIRDPKLTGHPWTADAFLEEWLTFARAIRARVPEARFGMPDFAWTPEWHAQVVTGLLHTPDPPNVVSLTHHCYLGGPPSNPAMTVAKILGPNPDVALLAGIMQAQSARLSSGTHTPVSWRMTEGNTCYRGGKPGVSDVFAAALWSADYLLTLASLGYAGVNLHGGDGQMVANSLGGKLPGDEIVLAEHGNPAEHPHPYYTPVAHIGDRYLLEPVAYGMKFAGLFAGATMVPVDFDPGPINATAYAATMPNGTQRIAILNKDATQDLHLALPGGPEAAPNYRVLMTLTADSLQSTKAVLDPKANGASAVFVPRSSAVLFHCGNQ